MATRNIRLTAILTFAFLILLVPAVAMMFTSEVNWSVSDFIVAAVLLFGTSLSIELVMRAVKRNELRIILAILILSVLLLVWAELAVGVFGTPFAGN
jgi:hypothetical protein